MINNSSRKYRKEMSFVIKTLKFQNGNKSCTMCAEGEAVIVIYYESSDPTSKKGVTRLERYCEKCREQLIKILQQHDI